MNLISRTLLILCALFCGQTVMAETNLKWGKPTSEEMQMTSYELYPEADAVELCRITEVRYTFLNDDFRVIYHVKSRLKVLKDEGKRVADCSVFFHEEEGVHSRREWVYGLKATAFNLENGKVVKTKMKSDMEHTERVDKYEQVLKFSVPQVKVGTVIEYEYEIGSDLYYDLRDWYAQRDIPVAYTRYEVEIPEWFKFNIEETGANTLEKDFGTERMLIAGTTLTTNTYKFIGHNLPALKDDDFVWCSMDYSNKVTHELMGIYIPGAVHKTYSAHWKDVDKLLMDDSEFGGRLRKSSPLKDEILAAGIPAIENPQQRAAALWVMLCKKVRWNGDYAFWAKSGSKVLKEGTGTNADINFLYINMLHDAGIEAVPVVLRRRSQGSLPLTHASLKYLTTFVVGIQVTDSTLIYMDASAEDGYLNVLPSALLVNRARIVSKDGTGAWVNLQASSSAQEKTVVQCQLSAEGLLTGDRIRNLKGSAASDLRRKWRNAKDSLELIHKMEEADGIEIQSYQLKGRHDFSPSVKETIHFTKQFDVAGDNIYLNPAAFAPMSKNPFTAETRILPVEFPFAQTMTINLNIQLPEGYQVDELPKPIILAMDGASARIQATAWEHQLSIQYKLNIQKVFFWQQTYPDLKAFFDKVVESNKAIITITKQK